MSHAAVEKLTGARVVGARPLKGGDINVAEAVMLSDGREVFVKSNANAPADMFERESDGLRWLASAKALRVPEVIAVDSEALVLELITPATRVSDFDEKLGRGLALLHGASPATFGFGRDNYIGTLKQTNAAHGYRAASLTEEPAASATEQPRPVTGGYAPSAMTDEPSAAETFATSDWATFYRDYRLVPMIGRARAHFDARAHRMLDVLLDRLPELVGDPEPPARLHGDLWGGNLHVDDRGEPCLIDPAVYGGHREVDLAMMRLFGGFSDRVFSAYHEAHPLQQNAEERVKLYQLYPLLVHVNLFGAGYVSQALDAAKAYI